MGVAGLLQREQTVSLPHAGTDGGHAAELVAGGGRRGVPGAAHPPPGLQTHRLQNGPLLQTPHPRPRTPLPRPRINGAETPQPATDPTAPLLLPRTLQPHPDSPPPPRLIVGLRAHFEGTPARTQVNLEIMTMGKLIELEAPLLSDKLARRNIAYGYQLM